MKRAFAILGTLVLLLAACPGIVRAAGTAYPFGVEIIVPENSIDRLGYYHVPGQPGGVITLQARVLNLTDQPIEVSVIPLNAYSGPDGISYQNPNGLDGDAYALFEESYGLARYIETEDSVYIVPKSSMTVDIRVNVPDIRTGTLLGGIRFAVFAGTQRVQNAEVDSSTILIDEYLAIDTAIQIDLPGAAQPAVSAGTPKLTNQGLCVPVVNAAANIQENVSGTYQILDAQDAVLLEGSLSLPKMAPMSEAHRFEAWNTAWKEGAYTLVMQLLANGKTEDYRQPFTIGEAAIVDMVQSQQSADIAQTAGEAGASVAAAQKVIISGLVFGIPAVFFVGLLWIHRRKKSHAKRETARQATGRRYVPN